MKRREWYLIEVRKYGDQFETILDAMTYEDAMKEANRFLSYQTEKELAKQDSYLLRGDLEDAIEKGLSVFDTATECYQL